MDWRRQLKINSRRTKYVIGAFVLIYILLGIAIDMYLFRHVDPQFSIYAYLKLVATFQVTPIATIILGGIAIVSLLVTYALHDRIILLGSSYQEITAASQGEEEKQFYNIVEELKISAGLRYMPRLYIINADYMNAFASGYSEKSALIAVTRGLLGKLQRYELQAVIAHELTHIRHQDIKLTLTATVLANLSLIILDLLFRNLIFSRSHRDRRNGDNLFFLFMIILRTLLPLITMLLILYLSRKREFMADAGAVELTRENQQLANALLKIKQDHETNLDTYAAAYQNTSHEEVRMAAYIFDPQQAGINLKYFITNIFSTHPPLEERIQALGIKQAPAS